MANYVRFRLFTHDNYIVCYSMATLFFFQDMASQLFTLYHENFYLVA